MLPEPEEEWPKGEVEEEIVAVDDELLPCASKDRIFSGPLLVDLLNIRGHIVDAFQCIGALIDTN